MHSLRNFVCSQSFYNLSKRFETFQVNAELWWKWNERKTCILVTKVLPSHLRNFAFALLRSLETLASAKLVMETLWDGKSFAFPQETLNLFAKLLCSLKMFRNFLSERKTGDANSMRSEENLYFGHKSFAFPPRSFTFAWKTFAFSQNFLKLIFKKLCVCLNSSLTKALKYCSIVYSFIFGGLYISHNSISHNFVFLTMSLFLIKILSHH